MILKDFGLVIAPTFRSSAYIQMLLRNDLKPSIVVVLGNMDEVRGLGMISKDVRQELSQINVSDYFDINVSIDSLLETNELPHIYCENADINHHTCIELLKSRPEKYFVYSGYGGVILRREILNCGKRFLHVHPGEVPGFRGSTTIYYTILAEDECQASAFFLDIGIDNGPVLKIKSFAKPADGRIIDFIYDPFIRSKLLVEVIKDYIKSGSFEYLDRSKEAEETYFIIHPVLKHLSILSCN